MDEDLKSIIPIGIVLMLLITLFVGFLGYVQYKSELTDCEAYNNYGYFTEVIGDYWDNFNGKDVCVIHMEDGTQLPLDDFKTMSIREPLRR